MAAMSYSALVTSTVYSHICALSCTSSCGSASTNCSLCPSSPLLLGRQREVVLDAPAQHHDTPRLAPAAQAKLSSMACQPWLASAGARPVLALEQPLDQTLDVGRLAQPQQVGQATLLAHVDDVLVAEAAVAAHQRRAAVAQLVQQPAQGGLGMARAVLLARAELARPAPGAGCRPRRCAARGWGALACAGCSRSRRPPGGRTVA